jgi:aminoglycoside phosphotransferase (APT) family kinase protein
MWRRWKHGWRLMSHGFAGPLAVSQFNGGQSNPTYRLETPGPAMCCAASLPGRS